MPTAPVMMPIAMIPVILVTFAVVFLWRMVQFLVVAVTMTGRVMMGRLHQRRLDVSDELCHFLPVFSFTRAL